MPELPEVERGRRIAERHIVGKRIDKVSARHDEIVFCGVTARRFALVLRGRVVAAACRKGKHLWFELDQRPWPAFHFGMTGSFKVYCEQTDRPRFWKFELLLNDGTRLAMPDGRRLGRVRLLENPAQEPPISKLGIDPYLDLPPVRHLAKLLSRRRTPIKALLLDQSIFAGVGNWIADEVLYQAGISPHRLACELTGEQMKKLRSKLKAIIGRACAVEADKDRFPRTWLFHHRWGRDPNATTFRKEKIIHDTIGGRTTAWVPAVQC